VKVHPLRDGGWATALAHELAAQRGGQPTVPGTVIRLQRPK
jgi:hypothetical protein